MNIELLEAILIPIILSCVFLATLYPYYDYLDKLSSSSQTLTLDHVELYALAMPARALRQISKRRTTDHDETYVQLALVTITYSIFATTFFLYHMQYKNWTAIQDISANITICVILLPAATFIIFARIWAYSIVSMYKNFAQKLPELQNEFDEILKEVYAAEQLLIEEQQLYEKHLQIYKQLMRKVQSCHTIFGMEERLFIQKQDEEKALVQIVENNLRLIEEIPSSTSIAIDTNILMEWDDYLIRALKSKNIIISKRVQYELDRNKSSDNNNVSYKARRGIRRLLEFDACNYHFLVSKWDTQFLKAQNLSSSWEDEKILADYVYEQQQGRHMVVASHDSNFIISAKQFFNILTLQNPTHFSY